MRFEHEPKWKELWLEEEEATPRELSAQETARLLKALAKTRADYRAIFEFAWLSLKRKTEIRTLQWAHVKWAHESDGERHPGIIERPGKGKKVVRVDITRFRPGGSHPREAAASESGTFAEVAGATTCKFPGERRHNDDATEMAHT